MEFDFSRYCFETRNEDATDDMPERIRINDKVQGSYAWALKMSDPFEYELAKHKKAIENHVKGKFGEDKFERAIVSPIEDGFIWIFPE